MLIRDATPDDAAAVARVQVEGWRWAYRDIVSAEYLAGLSVPKRTQAWRQVLTEPAHGQTKFLVVAAEVGGEVVGFASGGPNRQPASPYAGELYAIYLLPSHLRRGLGRKLTAALTERLLRAGLQSLIVWVLSGNPARRFYEALGGEPAGCAPIAIGPINYEEVAYGWSDIRVLV